MGMGWPLGKFANLLIGDDIAVLVVGMTLYFFLIAN
jgi:hypothetical protein